MIDGNAFATESEQARFEDFIDCLHRRGRRASTTRSYRSDWLDLSLWFKRQYSAGFDASLLDVDVVEGWRGSSESRGKSSATVLRRMAFARTYLRWLSSRGIRPSGAYEEVRSVQAEQRSPKQVRTMDADSVNRLLEYANVRACPRDQAMIYLLLDAGLRVSELVELNVGDINFENGVLHVTGVRAREIPLPTRAARKLALSLAERGLLTLPESGEIVLPATGGWPPTDLVEPPDPRDIPALSQTPPSPMPFGVPGKPAEWPLFVGEKGRLSVNGIQRVVRKHSTFARAETTPQTLRNTFALNVWALNQDLVSLAEVLGLENIDSARSYTMSALDTIEDELETARQAES